MMNRAQTATLLVLDHIGKHNLENGAHAWSARREFVVAE
jgi:hypothetical protein